MRKLSLLFMMLLGLTRLNAEGSRKITGSVYDAYSKDPITGVIVTIKGTKTGTMTDIYGHYSLLVPDNKNVLIFNLVGYQSQHIKIKGLTTINVYLKANPQNLYDIAAVKQPAAADAIVPVSESNAEIRIDEPVAKSDVKQVKEKNTSLNEVVVVGYSKQRKRDITGAVSIISPVQQALQGRAAGVVTSGNSRLAKAYAPPKTAITDDESYNTIAENNFKNPLNDPLSTFSVDVDAASYANFRRFVNSGQLPPKDAVRIEEMINYFSYNLPAPKNNEPVAIHTELSYAPWSPQHQLLRIGLKAKTVNTDKLPASNLVFLIDVSGSMWEPNKLPLVQSSLKLLVDQLRPQDHVSIVVYAGAAGMVLPSTSGSQKTTIKDAIDRLTAGGSTAGGEGIKLAYRIAKQNFIPRGNNRVILATDGDFNVGASSDAEMEHLIEAERKSGVFLSVLGFGMGNYKDSKMETLADKGNGNYAYIDNITEARKTLVSEFGGTLFTVAKDVKLQLEFNPAKVQAYRLIGYENRMLNKEDFNDDKKDAGDMGVDHTVTALYEIIPVGVKDSFTGSIDPLKYQKTQHATSSTSTDEVVTIKFRYKEPASSVSKLSQAVVKEEPLAFTKTSEDFRFAAAVAETGMLLRDSKFKQRANFDQAIAMARDAKGEDREGYRAEFVKLAETVKLLNRNRLAANKEQN